MFLKSQEIADLKAQLQAAQEENSSLKAEKETFTTQLNAEKEKATTAENGLATAKADLETANGTIATHVATIAAKDQEIAGHAEKFESAVAAEVVSRCAAAGLETPIARTPEAPKEAPTKTTPGAGLSGMDKVRASLQAKIDAGLSGKK